MPLLVSAVVPVYNEEGAAVQVAREIAAVFSRTYAADEFEVIFIDDASKDATLARLQEAAPSIAQLRVLHHGKNAGKSCALRTGLFAARAEVIVTLDGDGQNPPEDAARRPVKNGGKSLVQAGKGWQA